jgi:hypothetical protein
MMCGKRIAMALNAHHDPLSALRSSSAIFGCGRELPSALDVDARRFVENTPW